MEKTLTNDESVKVKNLLTKVKSLMDSIEETKHEVYKIVDEINQTLR